MIMTRVKEHWEGYIEVLYCFRSCAVYVNVNTTDATAGATALLLPAHVLRFHTVRGTCRAQLCVKRL
jgi:hypothetical protein